jgi:hypothetical protein
VLREYVFSYGLGITHIIYINAIDILKVKSFLLKYSFHSKLTI